MGGIIYNENPGIRAKKKHPTFHAQRDFGRGHTALVNVPLENEFPKKIQQLLTEEIHPYTPGGAARGSGLLGVGGWV